MKFRFRIQTKLVLLMAGLTATILMGVLFVISETVQSAVEQKVINDFKRIQTFFRQQQTLIYDRLIESSLLIQQNSAFKANIELNNPATYYVENEDLPADTSAAANQDNQGLQDPASVYFSVSEFAQYLIVDLFIVTNNEGKVLARYGAPEQYGDDLTFRKTVAQALEGGVVDTSATPDGWIPPRLWEKDGKLYQVVTEPIWLRDVIGTITLGLEISDDTARQLAQSDPNIEVVIFNEQRPIASTLEDVDSAEFSNIWENRQPTIRRVVETLEATDPFITTFRGEEMFAFLSPVGVGEPAYYVAMAPVSKELQVLESVRNNIALTALLSLLITGVLAIFLGRTFSQPILRLVEEMDTVKKGNLDVSLEPTTNDEIGLLTQSFNDMVVGLRERLNLMKYVGSHTLEMIKHTSHGEVELGGHRKELAVLFSDIRGFTAFSENRQPEEVINMLNRYLGFQADIVDEHNGSVDKFVGDEMVALFAGDNAVQRAVQCAVAIQKRVKIEQKKDPVPIHVGIGINYGPMVLGNMGSGERMDYTVLGAAVNLGARLCSGANAGQILIPRNLIKDLEGQFTFGNSEKIQYKGFSKKIEIMEVLGEK